MSWIYNFVTTETESIKVVDAVCIEQNRADVTENIRVNWMKILEKYCSGIPVSFIFNIDESGFQRWADKIDNKIIVTKDTDESNCYIPLSRSNPRTTMMAGVCMDGSYLNPCFIVNRATIDVDMLVNGLGIVHGTIKNRDPPFMNSCLFVEWLNEVFIVNLKNKRKQFNYYGESILIMDGYKSHLNQMAVDILSSNGVRILLLPPHSSHILQPLDVGIFGILKRELAFQNSETDSIMIDSSEQTKQIASIVFSWQKIATTRNIISAFVGSGMVPRPLISNFKSYVPVIACEVVIKSLAKTGKMFLNEGREEVKKDLEKKNLTCDEHAVNEILRRQARQKKSKLKVTTRKHIEIKDLNMGNCH